MEIVNGNNPDPPETEKRFEGDKVSHEHRGMEDDSVRLLSQSKQGRYDTLPDQSPPLKDSHTSKSGLPGATTNMIKSILGSGILGSPYAVSVCGPGLGIILIIGVGIVTDYSVRILIKAAVVSGESSFQGVARNGFGLRGHIAVSLMQFFFPFLAMISYNVIVGDTLTKVISRLGRDSLQGTVLTNRIFVIFLVSLVITLPLSLYRDISKYSKFSFLSMFVILFAVIFVIIKLTLFSIEGTVPTDPTDWSFAHTKLAGGVPVFATAFLCHHNAFLVFDSMKQRTEEAWTRVVHVSLAVSTLVMLAFSVSGYATFKELTEGDLFENYCSHDDFANIARAIFGINIVLTYPIQCFVVREVIEGVFFAESQPSPPSRHVMVTIAICLSTLAVAMSTSCVSIILEISGVFTSVPLIFIMPSILYLKHCGKTPLWSTHNIPAIATASLGLIFCGFGVYQVVTHMIDGVTCSEGVDLPYCLATVRNDTHVLSTTTMPF